MVFETLSRKSVVQQAIEAVLAQPAARLDGALRRERAKAAMVLECAEYGYALAKVANVAKRAQISTASIYRDFGDRDTLMREALELVGEVFAQNWVKNCSHADPVKRIESMLKAHGEALADPFMGWIFRLYLHLANTSAPELMALGRVARDANLVFWRRKVSELEAQGHLVATDHAITVALLLGAIERRSIFARLAFGENDDAATPSLGDVAQHTALALFQVFGTVKFWASRTDKPAPGWVGAGKVDHGLTKAPPVTLLDPPSQRLRAYAQRVLARDASRLDAENRKIRVQLAAMLECIEFGYEAATIASVAARAGVSTATFYNDLPDKRALFIDAILLQARFRADYDSLIDRTAPEALTISSMVYSISKVLADPDFLWFHRVSMASEISNAPLLIASSRATRAHTEGFWLGYLASLENAGTLNPSAKELTMNALLGATQRRSVLSMVFFGADDVSNDELRTLATASTDFVLRLVGTPQH
jgi:AcrR family transcriptional regulator